MHLKNKRGRSVKFEKETQEVKSTTSNTAAIPNKNEGVNQP